MKLNNPITVIAYFVAFGTNPVHANFQSCLNNVDEDKDYFPDKISPKYSELWDISYHNTYKIITNKFAGTSYLLYQCGSDPPPEEEGNHNMTISVPLQDGLVLSSTTQLANVQQLGLRRQIKAYLGDTQWITSPCIKTMVEEGAIERTFAENITDTYLVENPSAVVLQDNDGTAVANTFVISATDEEESIDIYEWHKVYGALFNLEETANKQFEEAEERFLCSSHNAQFILENRETDKEKPIVAWARHSTWGGAHWDVASCSSTEYYCELAEHCSATLLHSDEGSIPYTGWDGSTDNHMTDEEFFAFAKDADHWVYTGYNWDATYDTFKDQLASFKSVKNNEVYDVLGSGSGPWFEDRLSEFDVLLQDFCEVVGHYDNTLSVQHERLYLRRVLGDDKEDIPSADVCEPGFVDIPWETRASECVRLESSAIALTSKVALALSMVMSAIAMFAW